MSLPSRVRLRLCREPALDPLEAEEEEVEEAENVEKEESEEAEAPQKIPEIEMVATARVGELKDRLNRVIGRSFGLKKDDMIELPRLSLSTGRRIWSDVATLREIVQEIGGVTGLRYGSLLVELAESDLRDPPRSAEEEAELERLRQIKEMQALEAQRVRRTRPKASNDKKRAIYT